MIVLITFSVIVDLLLLVRDFLSDRAQFYGLSLKLCGTMITVGQTFFSSKLDKFS
jgi:hypothetical protein